MLILDRIEILGFKSFCERTVLKVPMGITGIVGPNGCGKSNVVDAMNWVLGEQRARSLRSEKMEEVIFNGSKNRKPVNMAQVSLVWKSESDTPAAPEVTITRRLFRSGESQYEMNGEICRLKDIHSFFINEGFDPLAYSILEQGRIDFLFISKPSERRALIEEAAGVAEFKQKKRTAEMKLADNQLQLERVRDILAEVEKQLSSLKRQAAKTRRFQMLRERKITIQQVLYFRRYSHIEEELVKLNTLLEQRTSEEQDAAAMLQQAEMISSEMKLRFAELESRLYQDQSLLHQQEFEIQENQNQLQSKRQSIEEYQRNIAERDLEFTRLTGEEQRVKEELQSRSGEESSLKIEMDLLAEKGAGLLTALEQTSSLVVTLEQDLEKIRKEILVSLSHSAQLNNEQIRLNTQQDHLSQLIAQKDSELEKATKLHLEFASISESKRMILNGIAQEQEAIEKETADILERAARLKEEWDRLQQEVQQAFKRKFDLEHAIQKLDAQQHSSKFYNESARNLLNESSREALGMMMDFIETDPQYETAVENFLADKLNYLIVNEENAAIDSIDYLKQQGLGYCGFVIKNGYHPHPIELPVELRTRQGFIGSLHDVVRIKEEALPAIAPFIQSAIVVEDLQCAKGLIKEYPQYQFVTVHGDVILSPVLYAGGATASDIPGLIAIQRQRKEHETELSQIDDRLLALEADVRGIQDRLDTSNRELVRLNELREMKKKDGLMVQMEIDQNQKEYTREQKMMEILMHELDQLRGEREAVQARADEFLRQLQEESARRVQKESEFQEIEKTLVFRKEEQAVLQSNVQEFRVQNAEMKERYRALAFELERLSRQLQNLGQAIEDNRKQREQKEQEIHDAEERCGELELRQVELLRVRDEQRCIIQERERSKESLSQEISTQENSVQQARSALEQVRNERTALQIEKARVDTEKKDLLARCSEEMGMDIQSLTLPESDYSAMDEETLKTHLAETEAKIERLGSINMLALDEYIQLEERHKFLSTQYEDLKTSIETLLETIQRIDKTSLERFKEAFQAVQNHFQDLFQRLFNGGKCEIVLIDPDNPGESGIDIHVQPPGKRLQNMNLLSGGEKTLTGIAFLMALFQYHSSPFCVMDEVDAALDEVNVLRFTSLIEEMKKQIQFVIVTHNKRTMEASDQLYGVTMGEPGVSTVLSAKFTEAEAFIN